MLETIKDFPVPLQPGDLLLYASKGFFALLIQFKSWHRTTHCEVYIGDGISAASRDGIGVNTYPVRLNDLQFVLRPNLPFSLTAALAWFLTTAKGQKYDFVGLLRFAWRSKVVPDKSDNKMFCSEFVTRLYRAGGFNPMGHEDADAVAPSDFLKSDDFDETWSK